MEIDAVLEILREDPGADLDIAEVALVLARDEYPELDVEAYLAEIDGMAHEARRYVKSDIGVSVVGLCRYLFHEMGFRGNVQNYYDPRNSYLNEVLDLRTGIPITLSAIVMAVGRRVGLEVAGVGLPGHFVAKAVAGPREVLFDPFHGGRLLAPETCERLVERVTGSPFQATPATLSAIPLGWMVQRMLNNLKALYLRAEDFDRVIRVIERICQLSPNDPRERRDLGICFLQAGQPGKAIDHLAGYLDALPGAEDCPTITRLLGEAQAEVGKWN
jgi:regulator of sirC expression with transglutaminase-like and TPR domain